MGVWGRELANGQIAERGTRQYLEVGIQDLINRGEEGRTLGVDLQTALAANRLRYLLVSVIVTGEQGNQQAESIESQEYKLA